LLNFILTDDIRDSREIVTLIAYVLTTPLAYMFSLDDIVEGEQYIFLLSYFPRATKRASTDLSLMVPLHFLNTVHRLIDVLQRGLHFILNCSSIDMIPEIGRTLLQLVEAELASIWCVIVFFIR
jgi:hypothetical protein